MRWGPAPCGGSHEGGKVPTHSETPHGRSQGDLWTLRGESSNRCSEGKTEIIHHRDLVKLPFPVEKWPECLHSEWRVSRLRLWGSDSRERTEVDYHEDEEVSMIQLREFREKTGPAREARDHCCRKALTPHAHGMQDPIFTSARGKRRQQRSVTPETESLAGEPDAEIDTTAVCDTRGGNMGY